MTLTLERSRLVLGWWCAVHVVLAAACGLVAGPLTAKLAALAALLCHAALRRPGPSPASIVVGSDATCVVPDWGSTPAPLGPRTLVCRAWIRLDLASGTSPARRDLVLFVDQVCPDQWARLRALLERVRCDPPHVSRRLREPI